MATIMYSKRQRADIYFHAAECITQVEWCCCYAIQVAAKHSFDYREVEFEILFPEFYLFKPDEANYSWFGDVGTKENQDNRILALLFAREIALNP